MHRLTILAAILAVSPLATSGPAAASSGDDGYIAALKPGITLQGIRDLLGEGYEFYPNLFSFTAKNRNRIWVSVSPTDRGTVERIVLFQYDSPGEMFPKPVIVFNLIEKTKHRSCDQVKVDRKGWTTIAQIDVVWGPPDQIVGSGLTYYLYGMEDGSTASWMPHFPNPKYPGKVRLSCFKNGS